MILRHAFTGALTFAFPKRLPKFVAAECEQWRRFIDEAHQRPHRFLVTHQVGEKPDSIHQQRAFGGLSRELQQFRTLSFVRREMMLNTRDQVTDVSAQLSETDRMRNELSGTGDGGPKASSSGRHSLYAAPE
jgi:hypothetical protein